MTVGNMAFPRLHGRAPNRPSRGRAHDHRQTAAPRRGAARRSDTEDAVILTDAVLEVTMLGRYTTPQM